MNYYKLFKGGREIAAAYLIDDYEAADFAKFIHETRNYNSPITVVRFDDYTAFDEGGETIGKYTDYSTGFQWSD